MLSKYSSEKKVVFGSTVSGRDEQFLNTIGMISEILLFTLEGLLINTIPCVVTLKSHVKVVEWMKQNQLSEVTARENSNASLNLISSCSGLPKSGLHFS